MKREHLKVIFVVSSETQTNVDTVRSNLVCAPI